MENMDNLGRLCIIILDSQNSLYFLFYFFFLVKSVEATLFPMAASSSIAVFEIDNTLGEDIKQ